MPRKSGGDWTALLRWPGWALALLALGSAFAPMRPSLVQGLHWAVCVFGLIEAGVCSAKGRRWPFFIYAALVVLLNPVRPFQFGVQLWRLIHAGTGIWLAADQVAPS